MVHRLLLLVLPIGLMTLCSCSRSSSPVPLPETAESNASQADVRPILKVAIRAEGVDYEHVDVATHWSANGKQWLDDGSAPDLDTDQGLSEFWDDEGQMVANPHRAATRIENNVFQIKRPPPFVVLAIDNKLELGGLALVTDDSRKELEINLKPLIRVHGEVRIDGEIPKWSYASIYPGGMTAVPD